MDNTQRIERLGRESRKFDGCATFSSGGLVPTFTGMTDSIYIPKPARLRGDVFNAEAAVWASAIFMAGDDGGKADESDPGTERGVATKSRPKTKKPSMYRVLLMNDDYTPMEFVVLILKSIFNKTEEEATQVMLNVHQSGMGVCGVYTFDIAETKVTQVMDAAKRGQHPLQCTLEKA